MDVTLKCVFEKRQQTEAGICTALERNSANKAQAVLAARTDTRGVRSGSGAGHRGPALRRWPCSGAVVASGHLNWHEQVALQTGQYSAAVETATGWGSERQAQVLRQGQTVLTARLVRVSLK
jgi:hypothetical protein